MILLAGLTPAAELIVSNNVITPDSTIELRFDQSMVDLSKVGSVADPPPMVTTPPLTGEFKWTSTRSGQFRLTQAPPFGASISIKTRPGLKDAEGKDCPEEALGPIATGAFKVAQFGRKSNYGSGKERRRPKMIVQFNDAIDAPALAKRIFFFNAAEQNIALANVRMATGRDFADYYIIGTYGRVLPKATWQEQLQGIFPQPKPDEVRTNAVVIESVDPLPPGGNWSLKISSEITNAAGAAKLANDDTVIWGSIEDFKVADISGETHFDDPHELHIRFNALVAQEETPEQTAARLASLITVEPQPANYKLTVNWATVSLQGDFELETAYHVHVSPGLAAEDGLTLAKATDKSITLHASSPFVSSPAMENSQLAAGNGVFDIYAANFKHLHIRVKQLDEGELIKARAMYWEEPQESRRYHMREPTDPKQTPFEKFPGKVIFDKTIANQKPVEKGTEIHLKWADILGPNVAAPVFIEIEAPAQEGAAAGTAVNRAIVEFTDIGLVVKNTEPELFLYAFSLRTGEPIPGVEFTLMDEDRGFLHTARSDASGVAITSARDAHWILARKDADGTSLHWGNGEGGMRVWGRGMRYAWNSPWQPRMQTFIFSDRPVYRPGETAHVKAITRQRMGDDLSLGSTPVKAKMTVIDPRGRSISSRDVVFSANGTWTGDIAFPAGPTGAYSLQMTFDKPRADDDESDDGDGDSRWGRSGNNVTLQMRVEDFKTNTFEVAIEGEHYKADSKKISVPLHANYYMGKSLSAAKVSWSASIAQHYAPPAEFSDFLFGEAERYWHYGEERDEEEGPGEGSSPQWEAHGELTLAENGAATVELPPPPPHKAALPQTITVVADVTDVNQQTISASSQFQVPGAEFLVGIRKKAWYGTAEKALQFDLAAITSEGRPLGTAVSVQIKVERQEWNTLRVQAAGGEVTTKNQVKLIEEMNTIVEIKGATSWAFTPKKGGTYFITTTATDGRGTKCFTQVGFYVIGKEGYPWAWEPNDNMDLQPEKKTVKAGEELNIVVKTPISGTALVTVERNRIHRRYLMPLSPENPVVKIPFTEEDAPNAYVSVMVIRGSAQSPQANPMPECKLGYCEIKVTSQAKKLFIETLPEFDSVLPGGDQTITAIVKDSHGQPVAGSEVALYAVDEGVLSLMGYETPNPSAYFYAPKALAVKTASSLDRLLIEDLDNRDRGNKGTVVGGGGDEGEVTIRKNFVATAVWSAAVITDLEGKARVSFKAPDSLTRYRIMAVALKGADRFGNAESAFVVNKPLMLEPVAPRFAHVGDEILVKAVLHNTTKDAGNVELELKLDETCAFIDEARPTALASMQNRTLSSDRRMDHRSVSLKAGETAAFAFPVKFVKNGVCAWAWRARTTQWSGAKALGDAVESKFEVTFPAPALREVHYFDLTNSTVKDNLLKSINPQLLESRGELRMDFSRTRMGEARDALEHLLHYPYGCVEQTTSSTLPWIALSQYEKLFPDLLEAGKVRAAVQHGADRLLSMVTDSGGLAYWPGEKEPLLWASAYGGLGLLKAREFGIAIPDEVTVGLTRWIAKQLRGSDLGSTDDSGRLYEASLALYVLAKAGKAEASYQNLLWQRRDRLPEISRLFLALAMSESQESKEHISELLEPAGAPRQWDRYWLGESTAAGLRMMVNSQIGRFAEASQAADRILATRGSQGHWGTTFSNSWILLGLAATERAGIPLQPVEFKLSFGGKTSAVSVPDTLSSATVVHPFHGDAGALPLLAQLGDGQHVRGRLEVKAWPDLKTFQPVQKGFGISRRYQRLTSAGKLEPAKDLRVGDLVVISLDIQVHRGNRYLALEDPLPSVFEPVNPNFATQNQNSGAVAQDHAWYCDYRELRNDRALFFTNDWGRSGSFELKYLARVIAEGDVMAPPPRIEAMYEPDHYGLGNIERIQTLPMSPADKVAER